MSMNGRLWSVPADWISRIEQDETAAEVLLQSPSGIEILDIGKNWHGLHFLLTGRESGGNGPLADAVFFGGEPEESFEASGESEETEEPDDWDVIPLEEVGNYGGQLLSPIYTKTVAEALSVLSEETLRSRFNPARMESLNLYPGNWSRDPEQRLEDLIDTFRSVREHYAAAAERGHGMMLFIV